MPRTARASVGGICFHVLNRANGGATVFPHESDYADFLALINRASDRLAMRVLGYCLMPNHFHLVLWPHEDGDLGRWMQRLMTSHVRRHHRRHGTDGHIWQGRFKGFPIQQDDHLLTVLRYVERNPLRANLVAKAEDWPWSSLSPTRTVSLQPPPVDRPADWQRWVNKPQTDKEVADLRNCVGRGAPWGDNAWVARTARRLSLESTVRRRGRPNKTQE